MARRGVAGALPRTGLHRESGYFLLDPVLHPRGPDDASPCTDLVSAGGGDLHLVSCRQRYGASAWAGCRARTQWVLAQLREPTHCPRRQRLLHRQDRNERMNLSVALKLGRISNLPTVWSKCWSGTSPAARSRMHDSRCCWSRCPVLRGRHVSERCIRSRVRRKGASSGRFLRRSECNSGVRLRLRHAGAGPATARPGGLRIRHWHWMVHWQPAARSLRPSSPMTLAQEQSAESAGHGAVSVLVYLTAAFAFSAAAPAAVYIGAVMLLCHLIGLTYAAKPEHLGQLRASGRSGFSLSRSSTASCWHCSP